MDADPFAILLLRGRRRDQVLSGLRRLRAAGPKAVAARLPVRQPGVAGGEERDPGMLAQSLFVRRSVAPLPAPPPQPSHAGEPASLPADPPAGSGLVARDLGFLARDAASRAFELQQGVGDGGLGLPAEVDLARLAAQHLGRPGFDEFARGAGAAPRSLMRLALAWAAGGAAALEVLDGQPWKPPAEEVEEGAAALRRAIGSVRVRGERVSSGARGFQLRLGRDGLWYLLVRRSGLWELHDQPAADPEALMPLVGAAQKAAPATAAAQRIAAPGPSHIPSRQGHAPMTAPHAKYPTHSGGRKSWITG